MASLGQYQEIDQTSEETAALKCDRVISCVQRQKENPSVNGQRRQAKSFWATSQKPLF